MSDHIDPFAKAIAFLRRINWAGGDEERAAMRSELDAFVAEFERRGERATTMREALEFYAEQRNYRLAAGATPCEMAGHGRCCGMEHRDTYSNESGPGSRARAALAQAGLGGAA